MKRLLLTLLSLALILTVTVGLFACKDKEDPSADNASIAALSRKVIDGAIPNGESNDEIASDLLSLLSDAGLEESEIRAAFSALLEQENLTALSPAFLDLSAKTFTTSHAAAYRSALAILSGAVSPELAGAVYYRAAQSATDTLPYTLEDCRKLSSLLLSQESAFGSDALDEMLRGEYNGVNERLAVTALRSISASLRKAVGISTGAKEYLYSLAESGFDDLLGTGALTGERLTAAEQAKTLVMRLVAELRDRYDLIVTYAAEYLTAADAKLILGFPYEKRETVIYYGYDKASWKSTMISEEDYRARRGEYDEYFEWQGTAKGFLANGEFLPVSDEDAALTDRIYRLSLTYRAYLALSESDQTVFRAALPELLDLLAQDQGSVATVLKRSYKEEIDGPSATLDEVLAALPGILTFDATDGISSEERDAAERAILTTERYLHGYLPHVY